MTDIPRTETAIRYSDGRAFGSPHAAPLILVDTPVGRVERAVYDEALIALISNAIDGAPLTPTQRQRLGCAAACLMADLDASRNDRQALTLRLEAYEPSRIPPEDPEAFERETFDTVIVDMPPEELRHG